MMKETMDVFNNSKGKIVEDFRTIVNDAEDLLHATAKVSGEGLSVARAKFSEKLRTAKTSLADAEQMIVDKTRQAATATDEYVRGNPWTAVGVASAIGLLIGFLVSKRK